MTRSRTCVILESPFAGDVERNRAYLQRCIRDSIERGEAPFASHQMYTNALDDNNTIERALGLACGLAWLEKADLMVVYNDYGISPGMAFAIRAAKGFVVDIEYRKIGPNP